MLLRTLPFAAVALGVALGFVVWHVRSWRAAQRLSMPAAELAFRRRQFRRRLQTSALLACAAASLIFGQLIPAREHPGWFGAFWLAVVVLIGWITLLAIGDIAASWLHLRGATAEREGARARLQAELERLHKTQTDLRISESVLTNGHAPQGKPGP